jgi:hypothetical protein
MTVPSVRLAGEVALCQGRGKEAGRAPAMELARNNAATNVDGAFPVGLFHAALIDV